MNTEDVRSQQSTWVATKGRGEHEEAATWAMKKSSMNSHKWLILFTLYTTGLITGTFPFLIRPFKSILQCKIKNVQQKGKSLKQRLSCLTKSH